MAEIKNTFHAGKMNQDLDSRFIPPGEYRNALNIKVKNTAGDDRGAVESDLSNLLLTTVSVGTNPETVGMYFDTTGEKIYWFVVADEGSYLAEYDVDNDIETIVLEDTSAGVLNFSTDNFITGVNLTVDSDNDIRLLSWTDNLNPPRQINIETAKNYGANGFDDADISLIKAAPLAVPTIDLNNTSSLGSQNNIEERFLRFSYRYKYLDGEFSALSPFTEVAFLPGTFIYDFEEASNKRMLNAFNQVDVTFNVGSDIVENVDLVFKDSNSSTVYVIESFSKSDEGWSDDSDQTISFVNNKIFRALDADQLLRLFDAVPLKAKTQEIISNRIVFGNYTENYNLVDALSVSFAIEYSIEAIATAIDEGITTQTLKSNRDYEIGIVYIDAQSRMSTVLISSDNTVFIPNSDSINQNQIQVTILSLAPAFASKYRFFIKQTRIDYDTIVPTTFYVDAEFVYILFVGSDINKVSEGDFIYVKAATAGILNSTVRTKVLEVETQVIDFLDNGEEQDAGTYMKLKQSGFSFDEFETDDDDAFYEFSSINAASANDPFSGLVNVIEIAVYYGSDGLDDLTSSGTYTGSDDIRYIVNIFSVGTPDTYEFSNDDGATFDDNSEAGYPITGAAQTLENGVQITFGATTGHDITDNWIVSAKSATANDLGLFFNVRAWGFYKFFESNGNINVDDVVSPGNQIKLTVFEQLGTVTLVDTEKSYHVGTTYDNAEEWFFKDGIIDGFFSDSTDVWFRRGTVTSNVFTQDPTGDMTLIIKSANPSSTSFDISLLAELFVTQIDQLYIIETIPDNNNDELFYEIGRTYDIDADDQFHLGFDSSDTDQTASVDAVLILPVFNAFSWGNGFESYKIEDNFNATSFKISGTRPLSTIEDYRQNIRLASLTYSKVYEQTTNFNGLNEFNLSNANFKDLDDKYESIQKLYSRDTNLIVFQEDKVFRIPYLKNLLLDTQGDVSITQSTEILGTEAAYAGEYGISTNPESFAFYGNAVYFTDARRSAVCRLDLNGIVEISKNGMNQFFKASFRDLLTGKKIGAFDLYNKQYVLFFESEAEAELDTGFTITFDEDVKGWTSFHSYFPAWMGSLNSQFYTISDGQLYRQNDDTNSVFNNFYGTQFSSVLTYIVNQNPSDIKFLKAINTESNVAFSFDITGYLNDETTNITRSTISTSEFDNKEGKYYAYVRRSELATDLSGLNTYGLGTVSSFSSLVITMTTTVPTSLIRVGDDLYRSDQVLLGEISAYDSDDKTITLVSAATTPTTGDFVYGFGTGRINGSQIRGYNFEVELTDDSAAVMELFAVNAEVAKSFPS